jgi:hypothetical protein
MRQTDGDGSGGQKGQTREMPVCRQAKASSHLHLMAIILPDQRGRMRIPKGARYQEQKWGERRHGKCVSPSMPSGYPPHHNKAFPHEFASTGAPTNRTIGNPEPARSSAEYC